MNAFMPMMGNSYLGGNVIPAPTVPSAQVRAPQMQTAQTPQQVQPVRKNPTTYYCMMVDSYQDIMSVGLPYDGTPVMFMLNNSPHLYIAYMNGEKKYVCGYKIVEMDIEKEEPPAPEVPQEQAQPQVNPFEERLANLEKFMGELKEALLAKGGNTNESNPPASKQATVSANANNAVTGKKK